MPESTVCLKCQRQKCKEAQPGNIGLCDYFVAYYNDGRIIKKCEPNVPHRYIAENLRHTMNPALALIMEQLVVLAPDISADAIVITNPLHKILASILILDQFATMLSSVDDIRPKFSSSVSGSSHSLRTLIQKYFNVYSLLKMKSRPRSLVLTIDIPENIHLHQYPKIHESIISVLLENVWKHSISGSHVIARIDIVRHGIGSLTVTNLSRPIPDYCNIFLKGTKSNDKSDGFGFGLYWATMLIDHYNILCNKKEDQLALTHKQIQLSNEEAMQEFRLVNIDLVQ